MSSEAENISIVENSIMKTAAFLALFGLLETLRDPDRPDKYAEAKKVIYTPEHPDLMTISKLLNFDIDALKKRIEKYLQTTGNDVDFREIFFRLFVKE